MHFLTQKNWENNSTALKNGDIVFFSVVLYIRSRLQLGERVELWLALGGCF